MQSHKNRYFEFNREVERSKGTDGLVSLETQYIELIIVSFLVYFQQGPIPNILEKNHTILM